ncbi:nuclear transport factor 2 family protein [Eudoraea chungangensis]|uniref:nuclear transport factor 2 family protein n=1 Tax=Eudoraea chungangensis TaxID=1481905 RepID=UPI0023EC6A0E|nr:nuclear transport factor 2 family protein [Eudoraea chungangensis]
MKNLFFLLLVIALNSNASAQNSIAVEETQIVRVINTFFASLEKKDSLLMKQTILDDAQIWRKNNSAGSAKIDFRFSKEDLPSMHSMPDVMEIAKDFDVKIHKGIAMAWVPYEFWVEKKFSHCGVDVFTLFKTDDNWKIISLAYTINKNDCDQ